VLGDLVFWTKHCAEFPINVGFNTQFNPKIKLTVELSLMLVVASDDEFLVEHKNISFKQKLT